MARLPIETVGAYTKSAPVDVQGLAAALGIRVLRVPLPTNVSGKIECDLTGPCTITVNKWHPRERQRFTIAHEIAHYVLHRDLIGDGIEDDGLYRSKQSSSIERQANQFAAKILMPWRLVVDKYRRGVRTVAGMATAFDVSEGVAEIRLKELAHLLSASDHAPA